MEEPELGDAVNNQIHFSAVEENNPDGEARKNERRKGIRDRLRRRKPAPRPTMKGTGKKRFILSPSPNVKPSSKRSTTGDETGERGADLKNKRNLLQELNKVAENVGGEEGQEREENGDGQALNEKEFSLVTGKTSPDPLEMVTTTGGSDVDMVNKTKGYCMDGDPAPILASADPNVSVVNLPNLEENTNCHLERLMVHTFLITHVTPYQPGTKARPTMSPSFTVQTQPWRTPSTMPPHSRCS